MQLDRPITIAIILFIVFLLVFFLVMPEYKTFISLRNDLAEKKAEYNSQVDYYAAISKVFNDLNARQKDLQKIDDALPTDSAQGKLIYFLQKTARENGMIFKALFLSKGSSASKDQKIGIKSITLSMDLLGDYKSLGRFLAALEKSSRIFEVSAISFGSGAQSSEDLENPQSSQIYSFNLQIKTNSY